MEFKHYYNLFSIGGYYGLGTTVSGEPRTPPPVNSKPTLSFHDIYPIPTNPSRFVQLYKGEKSYWRTRDRIEHVIYEDRLSKLMIITSKNVSISSVPTINPVSSPINSPVSNPVSPTSALSSPSSSSSSSQTQQQQPPITLESIREKNRTNGIFRTIFVDLELLYGEIESKASGNPRDKPIYSIADIKIRKDEEIQKSAVDYILARIHPLADPIPWPIFGSDGYMIEIPTTDAENNTVEPNTVAIKPLELLNPMNYEERMCKLNKFHMDSYKTLEVAPPPIGYIPMISSKSNSNQGNSVHDTERIFYMTANVKSKDMTNGIESKPLLEFIQELDAINLGPYTPAPPIPQQTVVISPNASKRRSKLHKLEINTMSIDTGTSSPPPINSNTSRHVTPRDNSTNGMNNAANLSPSDIKLPQISPNGSTPSHNTGTNNSNNMNNTTNTNTNSKGSSRLSLHKPPSGQPLSPPISSTSTPNSNPSSMSKNGEVSTRKSVISPTGSNVTSGTMTGSISPPGIATLKKGAEVSFRGKLSPTGTTMTSAMTTIQSTARAMTANSNTITQSNAQSMTRPDTSSAVGSVNTGNNLSGLLSPLALTLSSTVAKEQVKDQGQPNRANLTKMKSSRLSSRGLGLTTGTTNSISGTGVSSSLGTVMEKNEQPPSIITSMRRGSRDKEKEKDNMTKKRIGIQESSTRNSPTNMNESFQTMNIKTSPKSPKNSILNIKTNVSSMKENVSVSEENATIIQDGPSFPRNSIPSPRTSMISNNPHKSILFLPTVNENDTIISPLPITPLSTISNEEKIVAVDLNGTSNTTTIIRSESPKSINSSHYLPTNYKTSLGSPRPTTPRPDDTIPIPDSHRSSIQSGSVQSTTGHTPKASLGQAGGQIQVFTFPMEVLHSQATIDMTIPSESMEEHKVNNCSDVVAAGAGTATAIKPMTSQENNKERKNSLERSNSKSNMGGNNRIPSPALSPSARKKQPSFRL